MTGVHSSSAGIPKAPDGGWGWVVVFASFLIHVIADGVTYTFGIFYLEILKYFGTSKAMAAWVASIMTGTTYCIGPIASGLTNKYGCRFVTIIGALFSSLGLILSLFAPNVVYLYFTIGILTGFGFGLMYLPAIVSVTCYFEKKRAFATGIAVCGSGIGSAILAPLTEWLIELYGWKGAMLIISGLVLNCCVCGTLFRPIVEFREKIPEKNGLLNHIREDNPPHVKDSFPVKATLKISVTTSIDEEDEDAEQEANNEIMKIECVSLANISEENEDQYRWPSKNCYSMNKISETPHRDCLISEQMQTTMSLSSVQESVAESPILTNTERRRSYSLSPGILYRKDIFYSGSLINIPQYRSNPDFIQTSLSKKKKNPNDWLLFRCLHCSQEMIDTFIVMLDFTLLKNSTFLIFAISNFLTSIGFFGPHIYTKDRVVGLNIASDKDASFLLSIIGISSTIGRLVFGYLSDHSFINRLWLYSGSLTFCGLVTMFSSFAKSYSLMVIYCTAFGVSCGTYVSLTSVILVDLLGIEKLTNAFGIVLLFQGVASFMGPPIIGWLYDISGSYDPGFYVAGALISISGIMLFFIGFAKYFKTIRKNFSI